MTSTPESMRDHWWWRPRVRPGRRLLVWHILSGKQSDVHDLVRHFHQVGIDRPPDVCSTSYRGGRCPASMKSDSARDGSNRD